MSETFHQKITGAVARGWCHVVNARKTMDPDLAHAIVHEVLLATEEPDNMPWLRDLHALCAMLGIAPGHIQDRMVALDEIVRSNYHDPQEQSFSHAVGRARVNAGLPYADQGLTPMGSVAHLVGILEANLRGWRDAVLQHCKSVGIQAAPGDEPGDVVDQLVGRLLATATNPWRDAVLRQCEGVDLTSKDPGDVVNALVDRIRNRSVSSGAVGFDELLTDAAAERGLPNTGDSHQRFKRLLDYGRMQGEERYGSAMCKHIGTNWAEEGRSPEEITRVFAQKVGEKQPQPWRDAAQAALRAAGASTTIPLYHDPAQAIEAIVDQARRNALIGVMEYLPQLLNRAMDDLRHDIANPGSLGSVSKTGMQLSSATARIARGLADMQRAGNRL